MKKAMLATVAAVAIVIVAVGGAYAGSMNPPAVNVSGTVGGLCKAGVTGVMSFAIPDPSAPGPIAATVTDATVFCSNTTAYTVTAVSTNAGGSAASCAGPGGITGQLKDTNNDTMNYTFTCGTASGTGAGFAAGKDQKLNLAGSIASPAYINAPTNNTYADVITLTVSY